MTTKKTKKSPLVTLRPKAGLRVPDPKTGKPIAAEGQRVRLDRYWLRRLRDGDVEPVEKPKPSRSTPATKES